ncbi:MAG: MFS transporter [Pseudomonadota bacterium]
MDERLGFVATVKSFPRTFWVANTMEIFERMAWYGFFSLSTLYITGSVAEGGLGFSSEDRGLLQGVVTFFLYLFPFITGALGDRYGFKKMLIIAYIILAPTYYLLGQFKTLPSFFAIFMAVAVGAAIFKPLIAGTIGKVTNKNTASMGFGIFYMMVNVGGLLGPFIAGAIRNAGWNWVFIASAIWISLNIPILLIFYKEPTKEVGSAQKRSFNKVMSDMVEVIGNMRFFVMIFGVLFIFVLGSKWLSMKEVFLYNILWIVGNMILDMVLAVSAKNEWRMKTGNVRFMVFLLLISSFWIAFNQLFITLPEYIRDFTNTKPLMDSIAAFLGSVGFSEGFVDKIVYIFAKNDGTIKPEHFISINAAGIVVFQVIVSYFVTRMNDMITMLLGIAVTALSFLLFAFWGANPIIVALGVLVFSFGEMMASPKSQEYVAKAVAPPDKVGMFMGYYFWSFALGNLFGGLLSGRLYGWLARDLGRPDIMWIIFAGFSLLCVALLYVYHIVLGKKIVKENLAKVDANSGTSE